MTRSLLKLIVLAAAALALALGALGAQTSGQEKKVDAVKLYAEIAGNYDFEFQGQTLSLTFREKDGKLWAAERGDEVNFVEVKPLDLETMKFEATNPEGQYYEILFGRDEGGKITKCTLKTGGIEVPGVRVK
ncbi:MAG: hypothetical protein OEW05_08295 [Candidatus Aminicenantes bacterium]|nr:hypothetical protein [Candidatus Aminicenantes bacterium]